MQVIYKYCIWVELPVQRRLPNFLKWCWVIRHPLVFRGLTGSQRTPGFWGVTISSSDIWPVREDHSDVRGYAESLCDGIEGELGYSFGTNGVRL